MATRVSHLHAIGEAAVRPLARPSSADDLAERALALTGAGLWSCDLADETLSWTSGVYALFGLPAGAQLDRRDTVAMYEPESRALMERLRAAAIAGQGPFTLDARIVRADGSRRWMRLTGDVVRRGGEAVQLYGLKQDITDERARWEALRERAERDALTGLAGRALFQERFLGNRIERLGGLVLLDVDGFKQINDQYGHRAGDACLQTIGRRLAQAFPEAPMVARIGGDEFAVLIDAGQDEEALRWILPRVLRRLSMPIVWGDAWLKTGASAGFALADSGLPLDPDALFAAADAALYRAKRSGRNRVCGGSCG